jgi:hypothetical protein
MRFMRRELDLRALGGVSQVKKGKRVLVTGRSNL